MPGDLCEVSEPCQCPSLLSILEWMLPDPVTPDRVLLGPKSRDDLSPWSAAIVIGNRKGLENELRSSTSLSSIRSFRAFPNVETPRFLYPADVPFRRFPALLRPRSQSLKKVLMSNVLKGMPGLIERRSTHIMMMTEQESLISQLLNEFNVPSRTAIYVGYRDGRPRPTVWGFDSSFRIATIGKYGSGDTEQQALYSEHRTLSRLNGMHRFVGRVPEPLALGIGHLGSMLITNALKGGPGPLSVDAAVQEWLDLCVLGPALSVTSSPTLQALEGAAHHRGGVALEAFQRFVRPLQATVAPTTIVHGDFTPWNILVRNGTAHVFDWETVDFRGIPEWDRIFYNLRSGLIVNDWSAKKLTAEVLLLADQGSIYFRSYEWRSFLVLSLVNLLVKELNPKSCSAVKIESTILELYRQGWSQIPSQG